MSNKTPVLCFKKKPKTVTASWGVESNAVERDGFWLLPYAWAEYYEEKDFEVVLVGPDAEPNTER